LREGSALRSPSVSGVADSRSGFSMRGVTKVNRLVLRLRSLRTIRESGWTPKSDIDENQIELVRGIRTVVLVLGKAQKADTLKSGCNAESDGSDLGMRHVEIDSPRQRRRPCRQQGVSRSLIRARPRRTAFPMTLLSDRLLHERPVARVSEDLILLGISRRAGHLARNRKITSRSALEVMAESRTRRIRSRSRSRRVFSNANLKPWAARMFADLEICNRRASNRAVGRAAVSSWMNPRIHDVRLTTKASLKGRSQ